MWKLHGAVLFLIWTTCMTRGTLLPEEKVESRHLGASRTIRVYLPPSYGAEPRRRYPVLYVHDGQNVFSSAGGNCCFGWGSWELDRTADRLSAEGSAREIIIVAIDNSRSRYKEYRGMIYPAGGKSRAAKGSRAANDIDNTRFEAYADFVTKELKPRIDRQYRTLKSAANTGVLGSSLGGICSLSLAWERPGVFGLAASVSGSFQIEKRNFIEDVLGQRRTRAKRIRIYLDSGTIDFTGDDDGRKNTDAVADELRRLGWKDGRNLLRYTDPAPLSEAEMERAGLRHDKWSEARHSQHNEFYWRVRAWRALRFMFPPVK